MAMNTTNPNSPFGQQTQPGKNNGKSKDNFARQAAAAGIGAVGGGVAGWAANAMTQPDPEPEPPTEEVVEEQHQASTAPAASQAGTASQQAQTTISGSDATQAIVDGADGGTTPHPVTPPSTGGGSTSPSTGGETIPEVDPNEVEIQVEEIDVSAEAETDAILAEEMIDTADINVGDKVVFDNVGTVYTLDGEAYSSATFHFEGDEEQFVMVDVDGDEVFDVITDENFTVEVETPYDFSYGDAEQQLSAEDPNYMAAAENDVEMPEGVDFNDDIITT